jgi:hypothetical protein
LTPARASDTVAVVLSRVAHVSSSCGAVWLRPPLATLLVLWLGAASVGCGRLQFAVVEGEPDASAWDASDDVSGLDASALDAALDASRVATDLDADLDASLDALPLDASLDAASESLRPNRAFVTEGRYSGALGGVLGADAVCNAEARAAGLTGDFVAMIRATDRPSAAMLLEGSRGWVLPDGAWVADLPGQVADGSFFRPIHTTARGARVDGRDGGFRVWTGDNGATCDDWTSEAALGDQHWIPQWRRLSDGELPCSGTYRLFCFERGHVVAATRPPISGPRIFVTRALWTPNAMGLASADALCASEATMAGLGPSRALLPTTTEAALDRTGRRSYQRVDGFPIGIPGSELTQEGYVVLDATGAPPIDTIGLWTGGAPDAPSPDTCSDWTSISGEAQEGPASDWPGFVGFPRPCSRERHLYCVED